MSFKCSWHPREIAECWPRGSVVLRRQQQGSPVVHEYSYILSLYFTPDSVSFDAGCEYMLIEEPKKETSNERRK